MKRFYLVILGYLLFNFTVNAQVDNPNYDEELAKKLGADEYGMKSYTLVILITGDEQPTEASKTAEYFEGHMENIHRLSEEGKLIVAGPISKNENAYRGIFIFDLTDEAEVEEALAGDPAIQNGLLKAEIYQWYGSAALPEYLEKNDLIWKNKP
ncbi:MAG: YciI family protein [Bacteroidota bacterium]